jgi:hypothetical protein
MRIQPRKYNQSILTKKKKKLKKKRKKKNLQKKILNKKWEINLNRFSHLKKLLHLSLLKKRSLPKVTKTKKKKHHKPK